MDDDSKPYHTTGHVQPDGSRSEAQVVTPTVKLPAKLSSVVELLAKSAELLADNPEHQAAHTFVTAALQLLQS